VAEKLLIIYNRKDIERLHATFFFVSREKIFRLLKKVNFLGRGVNARHSLISLFIILHSVHNFSLLNANLMKLKEKVVEERKKLHFNY
jgi:hypothetical protein